MRIPEKLTFVELCAQERDQNAKEEIRRNGDRQRHTPLGGYPANEPNTAARETRAQRLLRLRKLIVQAP
jgi:hypothetical protein